MRSLWEGAKRAFEGASKTVAIDLPAKLAAAILELVDLTPLVLRTMTTRS